MKKTLVLVGILVLALGATGCSGSKRKLAYKDVQIKELERYISELEAQNAAKDAEIAQLKGGGWTPPVAQPGAPASTGDVDWDTRNKDIVATVGSDILFKPGSSILSDQAKKILKDVASEIKSKYPGARVRVEGHTDSQPIKRSKAENKDNWDLSGNRSQAVLHYLIEQGITEDKMSFAGFGLVKPVADNSSAAGMAKNRRVEIVVITNSN